MRALLGVGAGATAFAGVAMTASCIVVDDHHHDFLAYYDTCSVDWQCPDSTDCRTVTVDYGGLASERICTRGCYDDWDCPVGGICSGIALEGWMCFQPCSDDTKCPSRLACVEDVDLRPDEPMCLPW
jgi:hypothetical protein